MTNLSRDYDWYYSDTYVGFRMSGGEVIPFYICEAEFVGEYFDDNNDDFCEQEPIDDHDNEDYINLNGRLLYPDGDESYFSCCVNDSNLVLDTPKLGYIRGRWLSYYPQRSVKKGLCSLRIDNQHLSRADVIEIFKTGYGDKPEFEIKEDTLMFKYNKVVGKVVDNKPELFPEMGYLEKRFRRFIDETTSDSTQTSIN